MHFIKAFQASCSMMLEMLDSCFLMLATHDAHAMVNDYYGPLCYNNLAYKSQTLRSTLMPIFDQVIKSD